MQTHAPCVVRRRGGACAALAPTNNSSILHAENIGLTGGEGLSLDELAKLRGQSFR